MEKIFRNTEKRRDRQKEQSQEQEKRRGKEWHDNLETRQGEDNNYRTAKARTRQKKDITQVTMIIDRNWRILAREEDIKQRWQE